MIKFIVYGEPTAQGRPSMFKHWTDEQIEYLKNNYLEASHETIAEAVGKTTAAVRNKCYELKLRKLGLWTEEQVDTLKHYYENHKGVPLNLNYLSGVLNKQVSGISWKAKQLGLSDDFRTRSEDVKKNVSKHMKASILKNGHPKGMLGKKHSEETMSLYNSSEYKKKQSDTSSRLMIERLKNNPESINNRAVGGKREDLGIYVRSSWEANYARYLNWLVEKGKIHRWEYEVDTYYFESIKRGSRSYTPDFKVWETPIVYTYHEVKGYMDPKSITKLKRMAKYYPNEKVIIIAKDEYKEIKKWSRMIPNWE